MWNLCASFAKWLVREHVSFHRHSCDMLVFLMQRSLGDIRHKSIKLHCVTCWLESFKCCSTKWQCNNEVVQHVDTFWWTLILLTVDTQEINKDWTSTEACFGARTYKVIKPFSTTSRQSQHPLLALTLAHSLSVRQPIWGMDDTLSFNYHNTWTRFEMFYASHDRSFGI